MIRAHRFHRDRERGGRPPLCASVLLAALLLALPIASPARAQSTTLVLNEIDYDQPTGDGAEFIEIKNVSASPIDLDDFEVNLIDGSGPSTYKTIDLPAFSLAAGDYFVICGDAGQVTNCDLVVSPSTDLIQDGAPDAVELYDNGGAVRVDVVSYEGSTTGFVEGTGVATGDDSTNAATGLSRLPDGSDSDDNDTDFSLRCVTPGAANSAATPACAVGATKVDVIIGDDSDGLGDPGETLRYTVEITAFGAADDVEFSDTPDDPNLNTTYVADSLNASPLALDDAYSAFGNTLLEAGVSAPASGPKVTSTVKVLDNDVEFLGDTIGTNTLTDTVIQAPFPTASTNGGSVTMAADGGFSYTPPPGFTGVDTFSYTLVDQGGLTGDATVTINVQNVIWYVDNVGGNDANPGTSTSPFASLAPLTTGGSSDAFDSAGDTIFVFTGSGGTGDGIVLENSQRLIGEGVDLVATHPDLGAVTLLTGGGAGARPTLTSASGNAVTLAQTNTVRGLVLGGTPVGASRLAGSSVGTLTLDNASITGTGGAMSINGGTLAVTLDSISSTASQSTPAINLSGVSGTLSVTNLGGTDTAIAGADAGIDISGSGAAFSFGDTSVTTTAPTGAGDGIELTSNAGTFTFDSLSVTTANGAGLQASSSGTVNIGGSSSTIGATGGPAVDVASTTLDDGLGGGGVTFASLSSSSSTAEGIRLDTVTGNLTVTGTATVTGSFDNGIEIVGCSGDFTFGRTEITNPGTDSGGGFGAHDAGIWLQNNTGNFTTSGGKIDHSTATDNNFGVYAEDVMGVSISGVSVADRFRIVGGGDTGDDVTPGELAQQGPHGVFGLDADTVTLDLVEISGHGDAAADNLEHPIFLVNTKTRIVLTNSVITGSNGTATAEGDALVRIDQGTGWANSTAASGADAFIGVTTGGAAAGNTFGPHFVGGTGAAGAHPGLSINVQGETAPGAGVEFDARIENNLFTKLGHDGSGSAIEIVADDEAGGDVQADAVSIVIRGNDFYDVESDTVQADALEGGFLSIVVDNNDFDGDSNGATVEAIGGDGQDPLPDDSAVQITATGLSTGTTRQARVWSTISNNEFWDYFDTSSTSQPIIVAITGNSPAAPIHTSLIRGNTIHDDDDEEGIKVTARSDGTISASVINNTVLCDDPVSCTGGAPNDGSVEGFFHDEGGSGATTSNLNLCGNNFPEFKIDKGDSAENDDPNIGCDTSKSFCTSNSPPVNNTADANVTTVLTENGNNSGGGAPVTAYAGTEAFDIVDETTIPCPDDETGSAQTCTCP